MEKAQTLDYQVLWAAKAVSGSDWAEFIVGTLVDVWLFEYRAVTPWEPEVLEVELDQLTYLFDAGPSRGRDESHEGHDRVVAAWGYSQKPDESRDRRRLAGFLPDRWRWSEKDLDRGHLVGHSLGGGLDINLVPQASVLNRGRSHEGRLWRSMERYAAAHQSTPLLVRPIYLSPDWTPVEIELGLLIDDHIWSHRFNNQP